MAVRARRRARPLARLPRRRPISDLDVTAARFPEVTWADLAELEVDQMRQLTNAHCADEHNRQGAELLPLCERG